MILCWDNIENLILTNNGKFRIGNSPSNYVYYIEMDRCLNCGYPYLTPRKRVSKFCSKSCSQTGKFNIYYGKKLSKATKTKIGIASSKRNKGELNPNYKGGVTIKNLPLYNTFNDQISFCEETRKCPENKKLLQIKCYRCAIWYTPSRSEVKNRISAVNKSGGREGHFYCSEKCKNSCSIFNKVKHYKGLNKTKINNMFTDYELKVWSKEVLKRENYICIYCGEKATQAHHIRPKKVSPFYALDPDNGLAVCKKCHNLFCHKDECSTGALSQIKCD